MSDFEGLTEKDIKLRELRKANCNKCSTHICRDFPSDDNIWVIDDKFYCDSCYHSLLDGEKTKYKEQEKLWQDYRLQQREEFLDQPKEELKYSGYYVLIMGGNEICYWKGPFDTKKEMNEAVSQIHNGEAKIIKAEHLYDIKIEDKRAEDWTEING